MGKPLFKASDSDQFDILMEWKDITHTELLEGWGISVFTRLKVRPEAFPTSSPMPVY
jgi:hypothetical protein